MTMEDLVELKEERQRAVIRGLTIFGEVGVWGVHAAHDIILAGPSPEANDKLTAEQQKELRTLGWFAGTEYDCWGFFT